MGYANKEDILWSGQSLAGDLNGSNIEVRNNRCGMFSIDWTGASATDAVVKAQDSVDGVKFYDIAGKSVTVAAASGSGALRLADADLTGAWVRLVIVPGTETTGSVTAKYIFKGDR